jgi:DNA-directed RNA polymerase specialized sigma24 family protein
MTAVLHPLTDAEIAAELERAEPAISYAVRHLLRLPQQEHEDAAQTARLSLLAAMRRGAVFYTGRSGFQIAARNAIVNDHRRYRGRKMRFDSYERERALSCLPSREPDAVLAIAGEESVRLVMAALRRQFNPLHCEMFECYLNGLNQRDICRRFKRSKAAVCRAINTMLEAAAGVLELPANACRELKHKEGR